MIESIKGWVTSYQFVSLMAVYTYWVPVLVCSIVYLMRTISMYRKDVQDSSDQYYTPKLTIGGIVWHAIITFMPGINIFAMVFDCAGSVFRWLGDVMNVPLVRKRHIKKD